MNWGRRRDGNDLKISANDKTHKEEWKRQGSGRTKAKRGGVGKAHSQRKDMNKRGGVVEEK